MGRWETPTGLSLPVPQMRAPKALPPGFNGVIAPSDFAPARQWSPLELDILGTPDSQDQGWGAADILLRQLSRLP